MEERGSATPTAALWERLAAAPSVDRFLDENRAELGLPPFAETLNALCRQRGETAAQIIRRADLERSYGHSLFRGDRKPSRDTVLQLAFGFRADVELAQALLKSAGHSPLYPRVPRDVVIGYCLLHCRDILETQRILMEMGLPLMGAR